jgi:osmotically-inducible protein OsmY
MTRSTRPLIPPPKQCLEDLSLAERVMRATGYGALRNIDVHVYRSYVILGGRVPSYFMKQVAQMTALTVPGARHVRNDLDVAPPCWVRLRL